MSVTTEARVSSDNHEALLPEARADAIIRRYDSRLATRLGLPFSKRELRFLMMEEYVAALQRAHREAFPTAAEALWNFALNMSVLGSGTV